MKTLCHAILMHHRWRPCLMAALVLLLGLAAEAQAVTLSQLPLLIPGKADPNMMFAMSVEWPTAETGAYSDNVATDPAGACPGLVGDNNVSGVGGSGPSGVVGVCYYENETYVGYFNPNECYTYSVANSVFNPAGAASSSHECSGGWSGNLLNWASMTTLDEFRWATTGGTRDVDTPATSSGPGTTILKRTFKAFGPNVYTMRVKRLTSNATSTTNANTGAAATVPGVNASAVTPLNSNITVYFGNNNGYLYLWTPSTIVTGTSPSGSSSYCTGENGTCTLPSGLTGTVWFGTSGRWLAMKNVMGSVGCSNTVFGSDPAPGIVKSCYYLTTTNTSGLAPDPNVPVSVDAYGALVPLGGFQVRVAVCVPSAGLESNCLGYPNGGLTTYKPTGLMQTYATTMRFGVSSYLYNSEAVHNGGALRSNIKYVGPVTKSPGTGTTANANAEWDANGVFVANPNPADATASGLSCSSGNLGCSGVINFINGFGYTSQGYMTYDVISELYYEALRYFVSPANGPTTSYVTTPWNGGTSPTNGSLTPSELDGYPAVTTWQDPIQYSCQNNAIVTVGDSNTWCDFNLPGTTLGTHSCDTSFPDGLTWNNDSYSLANQAGVTESWANVTTFTNAMGALEGLGTLGTDFGGGPADSYFISGLAWWAHTHDIRPDNASQPASTGFQNVTSFFIDVREPGSWGTGSNPVNQYWLGAKYGGFTIHNPPSTTSTTAANNTVSTPYATSELAPLDTSCTNGTTTCDWQSAASGLPSTYFHGNQPQGTIAALGSLFNSLEKSGGSQASLGSNGTIAQTGTQIYQPTTNTSDWSGHLYAYDVSSTGTLSTTFVDAGALLASPVAANRIIFTADSSTGAGIPFEWPCANKEVSTQACASTGVNTAERALLNTSPLGATDTLGQSRLNYIRGDASNEGTSSTSFRLRASTKLGDILDSAPLYVGPTQPNGSARTPMVYVGANDGMLHAFSAGNVGDTTTTAGTTMMQEKFAFVPSAVIASLNQLPSISYNHQFYVDGSPQAANVTIGTTQKTVLVSGLRAGGQAVFALDITAPDSLAASETAAAAGLLWQFSSSQDSDLGYTYSDPQIVKTAVLDGNGNARWAVVIGNGYKPALASTATNYQAAVFVIFLDHPSGGTTWVSGTDYVKLLTYSATATTSAPNGMATPAVIAGGTNGAATLVYAGDLYGNLWKFDISSASTANWKSALDSSSPARTPLYTAETSAGVVQPITTAPEVVSFPLGGYMVDFGTGALLGSADLGTTALQTLYGIWDNLGNTAIAGRAASSTILQQQQILTSSIASTVDGTTSYYRALTGNTINFVNQKGWYLDLVDNPSASPSGERVIYSPLDYYGRVQFQTTLPASSNATCQSGGTGWTLSLDPLTGAGPTYSVFNVSGNSTFGTGDLQTFTSGGTSYTMYVGGVQSGSGAAPPPIQIKQPSTCNGNRCYGDYYTGSDGNLTSNSMSAGTASQRDAWREVPNDQ